MLEDFVNREPPKFSEMAKRFKFKFSRVIPSFQLCRSKKAFNLPENPGPLIHRLSPVNPKALDISYPNFPGPPPSTPDDSFIKRHLSPKIASVNCGCRGRALTQYFSPDVSFESPDNSWKKEATRLHIVTKAHNSKLQRKTNEESFSDESNGDIVPVLVSKSEVKKKEKIKMEKVKAIASVSSRDSGCFSSEGAAENEETETLISTSRSFSDDSSFELDQSLAEDSHMETKKNKKKVNNTKKMKRLRSFGSRKHRGSSKPNVSKSKTGDVPLENETPGRGSMLRRMMTPPSTAEGKVRGSVAVVKKSEDPYEDFKSSMLEMILEKQMFEPKDLEQLLQCFLSLNSRQYHGIIVEAFTEIWEALFCDYPMNVL
ncbi:transcription repressor OFP7-like [Durio zibethinus]|uniref:Transcription repressor n=1 Tax=Durio zibethinus TaxID=66656 RepID=A0A6P6AVX9_DURZI|nr:transcription repressor OFP7-like [Durio zibethinus]